MTNNELINILQCAISGNAYALPVDWKTLLKIGELHKISSFIYEFAKANGSCPKDLLSSLKQLVALQFSEDETQKSEITKITNEFEKNGINAIIMKGAVMKEYYPRSDMRTMGDADILTLVKDEKEIKKIFNGFKYKEEHDIMVNTFSKSGVHFEIHKGLFSNNTTWNDLFINPNSNMYAWNRCVAYENRKNIFKFDNELFYVFMIAHIAKHLLHGGGIGIRAFLDVYYFNKKFASKLNREIVNRDLSQLNLNKFEEEVLKVSNYLFTKSEEERAAESDLTKKFAKYIINGGVFGSTENFIANNTAMTEQSKVSPVKYLLKRAFPGKEEMTMRFPKMKNRAVLLPYYWIKRFAMYGFRQKNMIKAEIGTVKNVNQNKVQNNSALYTELGLK